MNEMTTAITEIKSKVTLEEWKQRILECQQSGKSVRCWCAENGLSVSSYYHYLRKIRESLVQENQIIPLNVPKSAGESVSGIRIACGDITVTLPEHTSAEQLAVILSTLKSC